MGFINEFFKGAGFILGVVVCIFLLIKFNPFGLGEFVQNFLQGM
jgi:hypothetical protein